MKKLFTFGFLIIPLLGNAQSGTTPFGFQYDQRPSVTINGQTLSNPWAGGLNAVQYSTARLNDDAREDLVVFDRTISKVSTFVATDSPTGAGVTWRYAPEYEAAFPQTYGWMLLVDYDGDGRKDLFTNGAGNVRVFHNESQNGRVAFRIVADPLITQGFGSTFPLFVWTTDIPAILDYDDDGDIDIITFDSSGNLVAYQQNLSVERTGKKDGLDFKRMGGQCWGHFSKEYCNDFTFGLQCDAGPGSEPPRSAPGGARPMHTGNTLTVMDTDGDGKKDLLFGFVSCEYVARLRNTGPNSDKANFTSFDSLYPAQNPIRFPAFAATFWEDVDGDGRKDLLASPNVTANDNYAFDFRASSWYYKNNGTNQKPDFQLVQKDFLQNGMLDLGENAAPALADLDGDGDMDLLVGYGGTGVGQNYRAGLWQFENKGTVQNPAFVLTATDYLGIAQSLTVTNLIPAFVDVDANGSMDLVLTSTSSHDIQVLLNAAPRGAAVRYDLTKAIRWPAPDLRALGELVTVTDVDHDDKPDLLVSKNDGSGSIQYYRNAGTAASPTFQLQNQNFGNLNETGGFRRTRSLVITDLNGDRKNELISADNEGRVLVYQFPGRPDQPLTRLDSLPALGLPGTGLIAAAADLDGDQLPDLMLGSRAGGLRYLKNTSPKNVVTGVEPLPTGPWAFPNPTNRYVTVRPPFGGRLALVSLSGQAVLPMQTVQSGAETLVDLGSLPDGTYLLRLMDDNQGTAQRPALVQKVVVWK